mgnify:CR=1 FL=1
MITPIIHKCNSFRQSKLPVELNLGIIRRRSPNPKKKIGETYNMGPLVRKITFDWSPNEKANLDKFYKEKIKNTSSTGIFKRINPLKFLKKKT